MKEHNDVVVTPLYYWFDEDIWEYIKSNEIKVNPLYERGYKRVGCIGCPMATYKQIMKEFSDYPTYKQAYIKAFDRMLEVRKASGKVDTGRNGFHNWVTGKDVYDWWIEEYKRNCKGQYSIFNEDIYG